MKDQIHSTHFRFFKNNMQSIAVLMPLLPGSDIVHEPCDGIMLYSFATKQAPDVFLEIKPSKTNSIYIAGGPHPSACPEETLRFFDYVVIGEGEETLPELIKILQKILRMSGSHRPTPLLMARMISIRELKR